MSQKRSKTILTRLGSEYPKVASEATKQKVRVHLDPDVLARLREGGKGWQTRANAALRVALGLDKG